MIDLPCQSIKRANRLLVGALNNKNRLKRPPRSTPILHERPLMLINMYTLSLFIDMTKRKPSVYQGVQGINCPLTPYFRGWGGSWLNLSPFSQPIQLQEIF